MNKKLLAIAVGAAMVAAATAATAGDEPTIYAKIHLSIDSLDNGGPSSSKHDGIFVSSNSSRLGIKGAVDLDGGLKAVYKYEMSTNYSTASGGLAGNRNAYLGLKGGFGQVIAGRHDMPFKTVGRKHDFFGDTIGDHRAVTRANMSGDDWADRLDNLIMYTNKFGAVGVKVAYGVEDTGAKNTEDMGIGIDFTQGPLKVMFANETHGMGDGVGAKDSTGNILAGTYGLGSVTLAAGYAAVSDFGTGSGTDITAYTLGAAMKSGMNTFKLQYTSTEVDSGSKATSTITAVGVDHKLGKNTSVYAVYASIGNDTGNAFGFDSSGGHDKTLVGVDGKDSSGFSLGMIHKF